MQVDEIIRVIEQVEREDIQDLIRAMICRYRELYPDWRIMFVSADPNACDQRTRELLELIRYAEDFVSE